MGRGAAGVEGAKEAVNAAAHQGPKWRRRLRAQELGVAVRQTAATASLSGKKKKRDADDGSDSDAQQRVKRRSSSASPVRHAMMMKLPPLQRLVDACRAVFDGSGTPPAPDVVGFIRGLMDNIGPDDVGLRDDLRFFHEMNTAGRHNPPIITCKTIIQCNDFEIAVFFLPLGSVMPLHDHPGMTVFSKLLIGSARVEGYDWVRPHVFSGRGSEMLAEKVLDRVVTAESGAWELFPDAGGNVHRFVAGEETHCAFLDILAPPYAPTEERSCAYYKDYELCACVVRGSGLTEVQTNRGRLAWLQEVAEPRNLRIACLPYRGPTIV